MRMRDELHMIMEDRDFSDLFPARGQPAEAPARLALATLLQFMEGLTDRQAAHAVRTRIDWKYPLCLELGDAGFDHTVLSEFRSRLLVHGAERQLFDAVLALAQARGVLKAGGRQRSDSTHVLGKVRTLGRYALVAQTLRHALDALAQAAPEWLRAHITPVWVDRYRARSCEFRPPKGAAHCKEWIAHLRAHHGNLENLMPHGFARRPHRCAAFTDLGGAAVDDLVDLGLLHQRAVTARVAFLPSALGLAGTALGPVGAARAARAVRGRGLGRRFGIQCDPLVQPGNFTLLLGHQLHQSVVHLVTLREGLRLGRLNPGAGSATRSVLYMAVVLQCYGKPAS